MAQLPPFATVKQRPVSNFHAEETLEKCLRRTEKREVEEKSNMERKVI